MDLEYSLTDEQAIRFLKLRQMAPDAYEKLCKGCGLCCLYKYAVNRRVFYTRTCCEYLDTSTRRCRVYADRLGVQKGVCEKVTPDTVLRGGILPRTCGYVEYVFGPAKKQIKIDWARVKSSKGVNGFTDILKSVILQSCRWNKR